VQNPGKLVLKNGEKQEFYYDNKSWYTESSFIFTSKTRFDTLEKMLDEFLKQCVEKHCK
jgi:hypothetical protein